MSTTASPEPGTLAFQVQFIHPEKILSAAVEPRAIEDHISPIFHGAEGASVAQMRARFAESVAQTATSLLADEEFAAAVRALPFDPEDVIVAFGDSLTDDLQSWAELLGEALRRVHGDAAPVVVNAGRSGDTTTHLLERLPSVLGRHPDWVIVLVGTNDGKAFGYAPDRPLVNPDETARNARSLQTVLAESETRVAWVLPPLADERVAAGCVFWRDADMVWSNAHLARTRAAIASEVPVLVDLATVFGDDPSEFLLRDGLHPNLAGQVRAVRAICAALSPARVTTS